MGIGRVLPELTPTRLPIAPMPRPCRLSSRILVQLAGSVCSSVRLLSVDLTRPDPFLNHGPFELGKHAHHPEQGFPCRRGRIDALLMNEEVHLLGMDLREEVDEV